MKMLVLIFSFLTILLNVSGTSLDEMCYGHDECPENALCRPHSCKMFICQCSPGYHHFDKKSNVCQKAALLGQECSSGIRCIAPSSHCNSTSGVCECDEGFTGSRDGFKCSNDLFGRQPSVGDPCSISGQCDFFSYCLNSSCECRTNFTRWTWEEKWLLFPRPNFLNCKTPFLSIDMCNEVKVSMPNVPHHEVRQTSETTPETSATENTSTAENSTPSLQEPSKKPLPPPHAVPFFEPWAPKNKPFFEPWAPKNKPVYYEG